MKTSKFKILGLIVTAIGGVATLVASQIDNLERDRVIKEEVDKALAERLEDKES